MSSPRPSVKLEYMEKLAVHLSLPRQNKYNALPEVERPVGLPINALPGWESIPLHSKLPMLKCPDNQVIFSKNKIGRSFEKSQRDFDSVCLNERSDYNPLHDPHLRRFYLNKKLLKRLRENGEITENNDVICTLKEFNKHRIPLHETYLSLIRMERNRLSDEKSDEQMIAHAEEIAEHERRLREKRSGMKGVGDLKVRQAEIARKRAQRIQAIRLRSQRKLQQIETIKGVRALVLRHKKELHDFRTKHRLDVGLDLQRKKLIALKKHLHFKSDRLKTNIRLIKENAKKQAKERARQSWEMHLRERIIKQDRIKRIIKENEQQMREWIENHKMRYHKKWEAIQQQLENRCHHRTTKHSTHKRIVKRIRRNLDKSDDDGLKNLTSQDIHDALETAVTLQNPKCANHYNQEDNIYKAAKYILEDILAKFDKDLTGHKYTECILETRINRLFDEVKEYVYGRAAQIIAAENERLYSEHQKTGSTFSTASSTVAKPKRQSLYKFVSFTNFLSFIGKASYELSHSKIKLTSERAPTPAGSLNSVPIEPDPEDEYDDSIKKPQLSLLQLTQEERIFIEHLFIKFKRQLIVGIGRQVLAAIECHRHKKILDVRKELQDIDKKFLVKIITRAILSYAINSYNFHANSLLCQHAIAGDIIINLQKGPLKPLRDPRVIVKPRSRCTCNVPPPFASYCK